MSCSMHDTIEINLKDSKVQFSPLRQLEKKTTANQLRVYRHVLYPSVYIRMRAQAQNNVTNMKAGQQGRGEGEQSCSGTVRNNRA